MNWNRKIIEYDKSLSKASSHSISKFKKVSLEKSKHQQKVNTALEKSQLKLISVQKPQSVHHSFMSNYVENSQKDESSHNPSSELIHRSRSNSRVLFKVQNSNNRKPSLNSAQSSELLFFGSPLHNISTKQLYSQESLNPPKSITRDQKIDILLKGLKSLVQQFKGLCISIKQELNKTVSKSVSEIKTDMEIFMKQYMMKLEMGIGTLVEFNTERSEHSVSMQKNKLFQASSMESDNISAIPQKSQQSNPKTPTNTKQQSRKPYSFKNKFVDLRGGHEDISSIEHGKKASITDNKVNTSNRNPKNQHLKIERKRTSPAPRINSFLNNQSNDPLNLFNQSNDSENSIRYRKVGDRSASKQVKRLQEKVVSLKKLLNQKSFQQNQKLVKNDQVPAQI